MTPPTMADWPCLSCHGEGLRLAVSVAPNAKRTAAEGLHDGALRVRLAAPPVDGKANEALQRWLADELGVTRRAVQLVHGRSARRKVLEIAAPPARVLEWLGRVAGQGGADDGMRKTSRHNSAGSP